MAGLPLGWEWDYDGSRWLYRYKPTGHVQYHFPNVGDEFPDYIDISAPAPDLAPEERLESQQQIRRHGGAGDGTAGSQEKKREKKKAKDGWKTCMSAMAQPVSSVWEDDPAADEDDEEGGADGVFQPESFMFLGPGTYTDVSPLIEEEEEAAKRTVVGGQKAGTGPNNKSVSPVVSENTTPMVQKSAVATIMGECVIEAPPVLLEEPVITAMISEDAVTIDGGHEMYELPVERPAPMQQFDPVGIVAEMPTEHTAPARIETHPDPVEMADNSILALIETEPPLGIAELPERTSPVGRRVSADGALRERQQKEERQRQEQQLVRPEPQQQQQQQEQKQYPDAPTVTEKAPDESQTTYHIVRKPTSDNADPGAGLDTSAGQGAYRPYVPGQAAAATSQATESFSSRMASVSLQRETSLMRSLKQPDAPTTIHPKPTSASLLPPRAPPAKSPKDVGGLVSSGEGSASGTLPVSEHKTEETETKKRDQGLSYVPSVLKPARNGLHRNSIQGRSPPYLTPDPQGLEAQGQTVSQQQGSTGVSKFPSVLRPARGRPGQQPAQQPPPVAPNQGTKPGPFPGPEAPRRNSQGQGYSSVPRGHYPPYVMPAPVQRPHTTAPDQPPARHQQTWDPRSYVVPQQPAPPVAQENVASQPPYPIDPLANQRPVPALQLTAPYDVSPSSGASTYGASQVRQPARPASVMPVLGYDQQQLQQRRQSYQPVSSQQQFSQMPVPKLPQPQGVMANPSSYSANFVSYSNPSMPAQVIQRRPTFTPDESSPTRPRSESQPSVYTPPPMEHSRRGSSNSSLSQTVNGSHFTDSHTPGSQTRGTAPLPAESQPLPPITSPLRIARQGPQVPDKIPLPRSEGSCFPPQNSDGLADSISGATTGGKGKNMPNRHSMPTHHLAGVMQHNPPGQTFLTSTKTLQSHGTVEQRSGDLRRSQSLRQSSSKQTSGTLDSQGNQQQASQPSLQGTGSSPARSHLLSRIEEHETEIASGSKPPTRPSTQFSMAPEPNVQGSPRSNGYSVQQSPVWASIQQILKQQPELQPALGQTPPPQHIVPPGQPIHLAGSISSQGSMAQHGFQPTRQSLQQPPPWNSQGYPSNMSGDKEKGKVWSKWFKGGSTSLAQNSTTPTQPNSLPAPMPGPSQSSIYGEGNYPQPAGWQAGKPMQPMQLITGTHESFQQPGIHQPLAPAPLIGQAPRGMSLSILQRRSTPDSAPISTVSSDFKIQPPADSQAVPPQRQPLSSNEAVRSPLMGDKKEDRPPVKQAQWARKPVVDYSGTDWENGLE